MLRNPSTKSCLALLLATLLVASGAATAANQTGAAATSHATYSDDEVFKSANDFFKDGAEDLSKVLDAMEEGLLWGDVLEKAIQLERSQRQYADQFRIWHSEEVQRILQGILGDQKKDEKK